MTMKCPPKNFTLKRLLEIKNDYYSDLDRGIDYYPEYVDRLIWEKQAKNCPAIGHQYFTDNESFCTCCKKWKIKGEFHKASDKKSGVRSHCKICRRSVPF